MDRQIYRRQSHRVIPMLHPSSVHVVCVRVREEGRVLVEFVVEARLAAAVADAVTGQDPHIRGS